MTVAECDHKLKLRRPAEAAEHSGRYWACAKCGADVCSECGRRAVWWRSDKWCRRCVEDRGPRWAVWPEIDADALLAHCDGDVARAESLLAELQTWPKTTTVKNDHKDDVAENGH